MSNVNASIIACGVNSTALVLGNTNTFSLNCEFLNEFPLDVTDLFMYNEVHNCDCGQFHLITCDNRKIRNSRYGSTLPKPDKVWTDHTKLCYTCFREIDKRERPSGFCWLCEAIMDNDNVFNI